MKFPDIFDLVEHCDSKLPDCALREMERERERTSPEKTALIEEIVALLFDAGPGGVKG